MQTVLEQLKPTLSTPFPNIPRFWKDPKTGVMIPKREAENIEWRQQVIEDAENDKGYQADLMAMCKDSLLLWINLFVWTFHQFDEEEDTGKRIISPNFDVPFITWEIQDNAFERLENCLAVGEDILFHKSRKLGASWMCIDFIHWLWLFRDGAQLLELSRTEDYVDKPGNMKALFQRHDYVNHWLPDWMRPPNCGCGMRERTKMHMKNTLNSACIDGESTTQHAASGDRRLVILLDEFAKVEKGALMRSATRDAGFMRIVNSTGAGPGTEYAKWKNSGKIKIFPLLWWDHPLMGANRYTVQDEITGIWKIRSPWYNEEEKVRSPKEMAREVDAIDMDAGSMRLTQENIIKHIKLFGKEPKSRWSISFKKGTSEDSIKSVFKRHDISKVVAKRNTHGELRVWVHLVNKRPDQTKDYIFGIDISKGQGASNSVVSIKCKQTGEKIAEWRDANTPPYEMAKVVAALAIWVGGRRKLPFLKWEMNGPGWDFGRIMVKTYHYPYYYKMRKPGDSKEKISKKYGWHSSQTAKDILMDEYDRALARGTYINHSIWALEEASNYVYYNDGGCGPAELVEENANAKKTHGDCVIADALTIEDRDTRAGRLPERGGPQTMRSAHYRRKMAKEKRTQERRNVRFNFGR